VWLLFSVQVRPLWRCTGPVDDFLIHVDAHQDRKKHPRAVEVSAQINILRDWLATRFLVQCLSGEFAPQANPIPTREQEVAVSVAGHTVSSYYTKLCEAEKKQSAKEVLMVLYLQKKCSWSDQTWANIYWQVFETSARKVPITQLATTSKLVYKWLTLEVRRAQHTKGETPAAKCPTAVRRLKTLCA
jgi:hypothetical protein